MAMSTTMDDLKQRTLDYWQAVVTLDNARDALREGIRQAASENVSTKELQTVTRWSRSQIVAVKAS